MENASKALLMAGSVLIAVMVISIAQFMFSRISQMQQAELDSKAEEKIQDYSQAFEQFNKDYLYGSEVLSLANFYDNYQRTQSEEQEYYPITIKIIVHTSITRQDRGFYLRAGEKDVTEIINSLIKISRSITSTSSLESDISYYENMDFRGTGRSIKYLSQIEDSQLRTLVSGRDYSDALDEIQKYKLLKSSFTQFKNTQFECTDIGYDRLGRINRMVFEENTP